MPELVEEVPERGVHLSDGGVRLAEEVVEEVGEDERAVAREADHVVGVHVVVADGQLALAQVEVAAHEHLVVVRPLDRLVGAARVVVVFRLQDVQEALHVRIRAEPLARAAHRPARWRVASAEIDVAEEERLVLHHRTAEAGAELLVAEGRDRAIVHAVADEVLIAEVVVARPLELIAAAARDGVDAAAREAALPHVVRRHHELQLLDRVDAHRLRARRTAGAARVGQAEHVVVGRAVDLEVVVARVASRDADRRRRAVVDRCRREMRRQPREVFDRARHRRHLLDRLRADVRGGAGARSCEDRIHFRCDGHLFRHAGDLQLEVHRLLRAERDVDVRNDVIFEACQLRGHRVRAADPDVEDGEGAIFLRHGAVAGAGRHVDSRDVDARQHAALLVRDQAAQRACRSVLGRDRGRTDDQPKHAEPDHVPENIAEPAHTSSLNVKQKSTKTNKSWRGNFLPRSS